MTEPIEALIQRLKINFPDFKTIFDELLCVMKYLKNYPLSLEK